MTSHLFTKQCLFGQKRLHPQWRLNIRKTTTQYKNNYFANISVNKTTHGVRQCFEASPVYCILFLFLSQASCESVKSFIDQTLGPYLVNVTSAAAVCSQTMCSSKGRCERRNPTSATYLHLDPAMWTVETEKKPVGGPHYRVLGDMSTQELALMQSNFQCKCYPGWSGESCSKQNKR